MMPPRNIEGQAVKEAPAGGNPEFYRLLPSKESMLVASCLLNKGKERLGSKSHSE